MVADWTTERSGERDGEEEIEIFDGEKCRKFCPPKYQRSIKKKPIESFWVPKFRAGAKKFVRRIILSDYIHSFFIGELSCV